MEVYVVISNYGDYEDYCETIEGVFAHRKDALKFKKDFDDEHIIRHEHDDYNEDVYSIVPMDVIDDWPYEETYDGKSYNTIYDNEYMGYTNDDRKLQEERVSLAYLNYGECRIEKYEVHEEYQFHE